MSKLDELNDALKTLNDRIWDTFLMELKLLFEKYSNVNAFSTPGYANYFNDGDACPYGFHNDMSRMHLITQEEKSSEEDEYDDDEESGYYYNCRKYNKDSGEYTTLPGYEPLEEYFRLISLVPDYLFEKQCEDGLLMFYRDGRIKAEDYSHD